MIRPDNGGRPGPYAALEERVDAHESRLNAHDERLNDLDGKFGKALGEIGDMAGKLDELSGMVDKTYHAAKAAATETQFVRSDLREERESRLRECSIRHCDLAVRPPMPSLDYDGMTDTGIKRVTEALHEQNTALSVENARLKATIDATQAAEKRNSERVRKADDRTWSKAAKVVAFVVSILTAAGGGAGLYKLLFGG